MNTIEFNRTRGRFGVFSNFALFPIWLNGKTWSTVEHYY